MVPIMKEPVYIRYKKALEGSRMLVSNNFITERGRYSIRIFKNKDGDIFFAKFKDGEFCEFRNLSEKEV